MTQKMDYNDYNDYHIITKGSECHIHKDWHHIEKEQSAHTQWVSNS